MPRMNGPKDWSPSKDAKDKALKAESQAYDQLEALLKDLQGRYPEVGLTFGYIGNLEPWGDDRHWYFFTQVPIEGNWGLGRMKFGAYATAELPKFAQDAQKYLESWIQRALPRLKKESGGTMSGPKDWAPGPLTTEDPRVAELLKRIKQAARAADDAFWAEIAKAFPEATTGDYAPEATFEWDDASKIAILHWLDLNYPHGRFLKPILGLERRRGGF